MMLLMHKDIPAAHLHIRDGIIQDVNVITPEHMPPGTMTQDPAYLPHQLQNWMVRRMSPALRQEMLQNRIPGAKEPANFHLSSLSDCYWIQPAELAKGWKEVNFHGNDFYPYFMNRLLQAGDGTGRLESSPDLTTSGRMEKGWIPADGEAILVKLGNAGPNACGKHLLSANEVIASRVCSMMGIQDAGYRPVYLEGIGAYACAAPSFIHNPDTEFLSAKQVADNMPDAPDPYDIMALFGYQKQMNQMAVLDALLGNMERTGNDFGLIRDAESLNIVSAAPVFNTGSCLGWNRDLAGQQGIGAQERLARIRQKERLRQCRKEREAVPEEQEVIDTIQETYELFGIPEPVFELAVSELAANYSLVMEPDREFAIDSADREFAIDAADREEPEEER